MSLLSHEGDAETHFPKSPLSAFSSHLLRGLSETSSSWFKAGHSWTAVLQRQPPPCCLCPHPWHFPWPRRGSPSLRLVPALLPPCWEHPPSHSPVMPVGPVGDWARVRGVRTHRNAAKTTGLIRGLFMWVLLWLIPADADRAFHWGRTLSWCSTRTEISARQENKSTSSVKGQKFCPAVLTTATQGRVVYRGTGKWNTLYASILWREILPVWWAELYQEESLSSSVGSSPQVLHFFIGSQCTQNSVFQLCGLKDEQEQY